MKTYKYLDIVMAVFVATLFISNISSSAKIIDFGVAMLGIPLLFDAGTLVFPVSYIFGDVLTEVYGYARTRKVVWIGFLCLVCLSVYLYIVQMLPGEAAWQEYAGDEAYSAILGSLSTGGIVVASLLAYLSGEFSNAYILARMKVLMNGKKLWMRTIGSTLVGQGIDTSIFVCVACSFGVFPWSIAISLILANYVFKVCIEVLCTPLTYGVVHVLKNQEQEDFFDTNTDFHPLHV